MKSRIKKILPILFLILSVIAFILSIVNFVQRYSLHIAYQDDSTNYAHLIEKETSFYQHAMSLNYEQQNYHTPYIPENFKYIEGAWNSGYTIQDVNANQYVWVPCTNMDIPQVTKLEKQDFSYNPYILSSKCYDTEYENFINSALTYGGFYVSKFEIGRENNLPVSKKNVPIWNNVSPEDAREIVSSLYHDNQNLNCELLNGYAYDTMLSWILNSTGKNNVSLTFLEIDNIKLNVETYTGRNSYNNIYDLFDDIQEITQENIEDTPISRGTYKKLLDRGDIRKLETRLYALQNVGWNNLTFRTMLYIPVN